MVKVLILGDSGIGKSSILLRYTNKKFNKFHVSTIGKIINVKQLKLLKTT